MCRRVQWDTLVGFLKVRLVIGSKDIKYIKIASHGFTAVALKLEKTKILNIWQQHEQNIFFFNPPHLCRMF